MHGALRRLAALIIAPLTSLACLLQPAVIPVIIIVGILLVAVGVYLLYRDQAARLVLAVMSTLAKTFLVLLGISLIIGGVISLVFLYAL